MRHLSIFTAALVLSTASAFAESERAMVCQDYADAGADMWAQGRLDRADDFQTANPQQTVVVFGAEKFLAPLHPHAIILEPLGAILHERNEIYNEEFHRCMNSHSLSVALQN